jgi:hypothetical protein
MTTPIQPISFRNHYDDSTKLENLGNFAKCVKTNWIYYVDYVLKRLQYKMRDKVKQEAS